MVKQEGTSPLEDPDHPIQRKIKIDNLKYWQNKYLFGTEYMEFVS